MQSALKATHLVMGTDLSAFPTVISVMVSLIVKMEETRYCAVSWWIQFVDHQVWCITYSTACPPGHYKCDSALGPHQNNCIPFTAVCDGRPDCPGTIPQDEQICGGEIWERQQHVMV